MRLKKGDRVGYTSVPQFKGTLVSGRLRKTTKSIPGDLFMIQWDDEKAPRLCSARGMRKIEQPVG